MKLEEVFNQLMYGELSQLSYVNEAGDGILPAKYGQLVSHINLGLTDLYKRFFLKEGRTAISLVSGQSTYQLSTQGDSTFIEDSETPEFTDDILKIERVYTDDGFELSLNDGADPYSCTTPRHTYLRVPLAIVNRSVDLPQSYLTTGLSIVYRANHPKVIYRASNFNPARVELELPDSHLEPLLLFIASRTHNPIGMANEFHAGNSYFAKYLAACQELTDRNLLIDQGSQNTRLASNGWV